MRNTLIGAVLAIILVAGLFMASRFGSRPAIGPAPEPDPASVAAAIKSDYVGKMRVGNWQFACGEPRTLPERPQMGNSAGTPPKHPPRQSNRQMPRCLATVGLRNPKNPEETMRLIFRVMGFQRVLAVVMRLPPSIAETGDQVTVRLDQHELKVPVRACSAFCFAALSLKPEDEPFVMAAKKIELVIKPAASPQPIMVAISTKGLAPAVAAIRRIDK